MKADHLAIFQMISKVDQSHRATGMRDLGEAGEGICTAI